MTDVLLDHIDIERLFAALDESERELLALAFGYSVPPAYVGIKFPLSLTTVGKLWGQRWHGRSFSEATIRYKKEAILNRCRELWAIPQPESAKKRRKSKRTAK